jgi:hypothetical protein
VALWQVGEIEHKWGFGVYPSGVQHMAPGGVKGAKAPEAGILFVTLPFRTYNTVYDDDQALNFSTV